MSRSDDACIERLATRQRGVVSRAQLRQAGLGPHAIDNAVKAGRLRRLHQGIYRVGILAAPGSAEMAAVLACGPEAAVSHRSAAAMWGLLPARPATAEVDVILPRTHRRRRPGIHVHRARSLLPDDVTRVEGIPVTRPARTLVDVSAVLGFRDLERALARADREGLVSLQQLAAWTSRHPHSRGSRPLAALLGRTEAPALTRSAAEEHLLALMERGGLPRPRTNVHVVGYEVDFLWCEEGVVAEVDGFAYHASRTSFEADRRRDADLAAAGLRTLRLTWRQITEEPEATLVRVARVLALGRPGAARRAG